MDPQMGPKNGVHLRLQENNLNFGLHFLFHFESPKWNRNGTQNGTQNDPKRPKIEDEMRHLKNKTLRSAWCRLRPILGRFGCRLGALETLQTLRLPMFREH